MQDPFKQFQLLASSTSASHYVVIGVGNEKFGVPANQVQEIIGLGDMDPLPRLPKGLTGPMRLSGEMIFLVKLQASFARPQVETETTEHTCILVLKSRSAIGPKIHKGVVVDRVERILELEDRDIEVIQTRRKGVWSSFRLGFVRRHLPIFLLDLDELTSADSTDSGTARADSSETVILRTRRRSAGES